FAPDLTSGVQCTVGGMLATNASGARALKHGYTRDHVVALRAVLNNGDAVDLGCEACSAAEPANETRLRDIGRGLVDLLRTNRDLIESCRPRTTFNRCGYLLKGVLSETSIHWPRLLVGSEGTLAIFTEATLRTIPLAPGRCLVLLGMQSLDSAVDASHEILET